MPRVNGCSPGWPSFSSGSKPSRSSSVYSGSIGWPERVSNSASRSGVRSYSS